MDALGPGGINMAQRGLLDTITDTMQSPLFLGGAALLSGDGFGGAMQGLQAGNRYQMQQRALAEQEQQKAAYADLLKNLPQGINPAIGRLAQATTDPAAGISMLAGALPKPRTPMETQMDQARLGLLKAQTAQASQRAEPDPMKQFVASKLKAMQTRAPMAPQPPPEQSLPQRQGQVLPQSYQGANGIAGLQFAADGQTQPPPAPPAPDLVNTPFGRMSRSEARDLGSTMLLDPRYATAGKAILDSVEGPNQGQMGKLATNQLEEKTLNSAAMLARLGDIQRRFDPKFLEIPTRLKMLGASWSAKAGSALGGKLSDDQKRELSRFASFRSASVNNLNTILKELSGAAVTPQEYERLKNDVPQAGTGILDGDDPVSFNAKLQRAQQTARAAIARYNFMRSKGLQFDRNSLDQFLSLDDVPKAIDQRGAEIESQLRKSGADPNTIDQQVRRRLKQEFGI